MKKKKSKKAWYCLQTVILVSVVCISAKIFTDLLLTLREEWLTDHSPEEVPRSGMAGLYGRYMFNFIF